MQCAVHKSQATLLQTAVFNHHFWVSNLEKLYCESMPKWPQMWPCSQLAVAAQKCAEGWTWHIDREYEE